MEMDFIVSPLLLTLRLASITTIILIIISTPLAWWLSRTKMWIRHPIGAMVSLPLVLPPSVLGFYLLLMLGPEGLIGKVSGFMGIGTFAFTFTGLVIGSIVYSLPFVVQPIQNSFEAIGNRPLEVASTLRASPMDTFFSVILPLARPGFLTAATLGFSHTVGEFGVILMIGGSVPGKTRVLSIAIYEHVEALEYFQAHFLAGLMVIFAFLILLSLRMFNKQKIGEMV